MAAYGTPGRPELEQQMDQKERYRCVPRGKAEEKGGDQNVRGRGHLANAF